VNVNLINSLSWH